MKAMYALSGSRVESRALSSSRVELTPPHHVLHVAPELLDLRLLRSLGVAAAQVRIIILKAKASKPI